MVTQRGRPLHGENFSSVTLGCEQGDSVTGKGDLKHSLVEMKLGLYCRYACRRLCKEPGLV